MDTPLPPLTQPNEPALTDLQYANSPATGSRVATLGLPRELLLLSAWAESIELLPSLALLLDASGTVEFPAHAGTVFSFVRQRSPSRFITAWQQEKSFLPGIGALAEAAQVAAHIYSKYPAAPITRSPSDILSGGLLGKLPLVALLSVPLPPRDEQETHWLDALRTWALVHWLELASQQISEHAYLTTFTDKLRLALDGDSEWLALFCRMRGPTESFVAVSRHLEAQARLILAVQLGGGGLKPSHRQMLGELRNLIEGKMPAERGGTERRSTLYGRVSAAVPRMLPNLDSTDLFQGSPELIDDEDQTAAAAINFDPPDGESLAIAHAIDEAMTPAEQDSKAKGVLLATVEQYQHLRFSWDRPNPFERSELRRWIEETLKSSDKGSRTLAAAVWLAANTSTSLRTLSALGIGEESEDDWKLALRSGRLHRAPPRRYNGWRAHEAALDWVAPLATEIEVQVPLDVLKVLRELHLDVASARVVGELLATPDLEGRFRTAVHSSLGLHRVTSGMLARWQSQHLHDETQDPVLTQLVSSHPRSGLPGACAYASYSQSLVQRASATCVIGRIGTDAAPGAFLNGAGSELHPLENLLADAFATARLRVNELANAPDKWIEHHNAVVAYATMLLLTVTAGRPITSPFEDVAWLDLEGGSIFVHDKRASAGHTGRLLHLPACTVDFVQGFLLPHLSRLSRLLVDIDGEMASEVGKLAKRQSSSRLPFLFLLSPDPDLTWVQVSESTLRSVGIFRWPLPWNLMRHRATTLLKEQGCDHEVVNAFMDHGEFGTAAYGPYSARVWLDDAKAAAPKIGQLLERLQLGSLTAATWPVEAAVRARTPKGGTALNSTTEYGLAARARRRSQTQAALVAQVRHETETFMHGRPFESISEGQWDSHLQSMLLQANGLPHPQGSARYEELSRWLRSRWQEDGSKPRLKRRYIPQVEEPSHFNELAAGSSRRVAAAKAKLRQLLPEVAGDMLPIRKCRVWVALSLVLESRVCEIAVLRDALRGSNFRVVQMQSRVYLEHGPALDSYPQSPFKRYPLNVTAAELVTRCRSEKKLDVEKVSLDAALRELGDAASLTLSPQMTATALVSELARLVDQANACEFPGLLVGYLNGTVVTAALGHVDWFRCKKGNVSKELTATTDCLASAAPLSGELDPVDGESKATLSGQLPAPSTRRTDADEQAGAAQRERRQKAANELFKAARACINQALAEANSARRDLERDLRALRSKTPDASPTCLLFVDWLLTLLERQTRTGPIKLSSILRYFYALAPCFSAVAYDHDVRGLDSEELTEFYQAIMDARLGLGDEPSGTESGSSGAYRTWPLALQLLRSFHDFVRRQVSIDDPDWSEIDGGDNVLSISPGFITEREYQHTLRALAPDPHRASHEQLARAFILLCAYRFGLRGSEATGLLRRDWVQPQPGVIVVLVRANDYRRLKTFHARRQVPLLFELSADEKTVLDRLFAIWESLTHGDVRLPLLVASDGSKKLPDERRLRSEVSDAIKAVTMNALLSLHHARHSFANMVGFLLFDRLDDVWPHAAVPGNLANAQEQRETRSLNARRLLLGTENVSRRSTWALARLLGHAHPRTTFRSYVHWLADWCDSWIVVDCAVRAEAGETEAAWRNFDQDGAADAYLKSASLPAFSIARFSVTLSTAWRLLRQHQDGALLAQAAKGAQMELSDAETIIELVERVDDVLNRHRAINEPQGGRTNLLSHLTQRRWDDLRAALADRDLEIASGTWDSSALNTIGFEMVGPSRQLLLWRPKHFLIFSLAMRHLRLNPEMFRFVAAGVGHDDLQAWLAEVGLGQAIKEGESGIQVNSVETGSPPLRVKHRIAAMLDHQNASWLKSSYEFVALFSVLMLMLSAKTSPESIGLAAGDSNPPMRTNA